ncbi:MAG: NAD(P)-binding domain-containing protein, partial [Lachnobacterium sp.]|nr:NAD(P)-binding domain-containing protein [Lachnobacterium sp.]
MNKNIGFIGCGNMGSAMMQGILDSGKCSPQEIMISCRTQATLDAKKKQFGVQITTDNRKVAEFADILFVAVKPQFYEEVLTEVKDALK